MSLVGSGQSKVGRVVTVGCSPPLGDGIFEDLVGDGIGVVDGIPAGIDDG